MRLALSAAHEINALWLACAGSARVDLAACPGDEQVAAIIEKYFAFKEKHIPTEKE